MKDAIMPLSTAMHRKTGKGFGVLLLLVFCLDILGMFGCQPPKGKMLEPAAILTLNQTSGAAPYVIGPGDFITLIFFYYSDLNTEVEVEPDGEVSLPLIGRVKVSGFTSAQLETILSDMYFNALGYSPDIYTLGSGDIISVKFFYNSDLNDEVIIRPDGKISLQLIGEVKAAGLSPAQLDLILTQKYSKVLPSPSKPEIAVIVKESKLPELTVTVKDSASQKVYITGEVAKPSMIPIRGILRTLDATVLAGGALPTAQLDNVVLLRYNGTQLPDAYLINLNQVLAGDIPDVRLKAYDIVYLPKSTISKIDDFMTHIWNIVPVRVFFTFPYVLHSDQSDTKINTSTPPP
jgi:protein involved in polysaccharide export with SLBB domain